MSRYCYKNNSKDIVVLSDLDFKFFPRGQKGDTADLLDVASEKQILASTELKDYLAKQILGSASLPRPALPANSRRLGIPVNDPSKDKVFLVYDKNQKAPKPQGSIVAYSAADKKLVSPSSKPVRDPVIMAPAPVPAVPKVVVEEPVAIEKTLSPEPVLENVPEFEIVANPTIKVEEAQVTVSVETVAEAVDEYCTSSTASGTRCKRKRQLDSDKCHAHQPKAETHELAAE